MVNVRVFTALSLLRTVIRSVDGLMAHKDWEMLIRVSPELATRLGTLRDVARQGLGELRTNMLANDELSRVIERAEASLRLLEQIRKSLDEVSRRVSIG